MPKLRTAGELGRTWKLLLRVRLVLWRHPWPEAPELIAELPAPVLQGLPSARISGLVKRAARWVPGANCLTQALALERLLQAAGYAPKLRIGVRRGGAFADSALDAHAWVECDGIALLTGDEAYQPLETAGHS